MSRYNAALIKRPQTMAENRQRWMYQTVEPRLQTARNPFNQDFKNPQLNTKILIISHPIQTDRLLTKDTEVHLKKVNTLSRQNIQSMNKKYRQIRARQISPSLGLYDIQNDRRLLEGRPASSLNTQIKPLFFNQINNLIPDAKKFSQFQHRRSLTPQKIRNRYESKNESHVQAQAQQQFLKSHSNKTTSRYKQQTGSKKKPIKTKTNTKKIQAQQKDIFMPQKQSQTGYMCHKFQSKLKKKCLQDNLHVMANLIRKKIKILDKKDMVVYLSKLASTKLNA